MVLYIDFDRGGIYSSPPPLPFLEELGSERGGKIDNNLEFIGKTTFGIFQFSDKEISLLVWGTGHCFPILRECNCLLIVVNWYLSSGSWPITHKLHQTTANCTKI